MKAVLALAFAAGALAVPAGWNDAPVKETTTTPADAEKTWLDVPSKETTSSYDPHTWVDAPAPTTTPVDPEHTWEDVPAEETSTTEYWGDHEVPVTKTTTVTDKVTTVCAKATAWADKGHKYTCAEKETVTMTHGPYTITIPVYVETSTKCEETPSKETSAVPTWSDAAVPAETTPAPAANTWSDAAVPAETTPAPAANTWSDAAVPAVGTPAPEKPASPVDAYKGAAGKLAVGGLAGVAAIAALLL